MVVLAAYPAKRAAMDGLMQGNINLGVSDVSSSLSRSRHGTGSEREREREGVRGGRAREGGRRERCEDAR